MNIRRGNQEDLGDALVLIRELAIFEKAPDAVENTLESMIKDGFGNKPVFEFFVAEMEEKVVGLALYYYSYSTWKGKSLYLEDLIVKEDYRGRGIGKRLFERVLLQAKEDQVGRMDWQVLNWNTSAINFYKKLGASLDDEWINCRLSKEQIQNFEE